MLPITKHFKIAYLQRKDEHIGGFLTSDKHEIRDAGKLSNGYNYNYNLTNKERKELVKPTKIMDGDTWF